MKNLFLYIAIFFGMVLYNPYQAISSNIINRSNITENVKNVEQNKVLVFDGSQHLSTYYKTDLFNETNDENDDTNHISSIKKKSFITVHFLSNSHKASFGFIVKKIFCNSYFRENFSRLPRFTYIKMMVLRI